MKIVVIGAGSASFGPGILQDAMHAGLPGATLALVDLHAGRLRTMTALARRMNEASGAGLIIESTTDRREALPGADVVLTSIAVQRLPLWQQDYEVSLRYGFQQVLGENGGPGGLFHTLRNVPLMLAICRDMEALCPRAWLLNYTNPESRVCLAVSRYTSIKAIGLCHGYFMGKGTIADITGLPQEALAITAAGLNHFLWMTACTHAATGEDLYPLVRARSAEKPADYLPLSRKLLDVFGLFPFPSDDHVGEYLGFAWDSCLHHGYDFAGAAAWGEAQTADIARLAAGEEPLDDFLQRSSGECAFTIIKALHGDPAWVPAVNVPNGGSITNLPADALVEVPAEISRAGVRPAVIGDLPAGIAALCRTQATIQSLVVEAAVTGSRALALQALLLDPVVTNADAAAACLDEMLRLQAAYLPQFAQYADVGRNRPCIASNNRERLTGCPMTTTHYIPGIGTFPAAYQDDLRERTTGGNGLWQVGREGVTRILTPRDGKVDFIFFAEKTLCHVHSTMGYPAIYPLAEADFTAPAEAVLMDLDGTSVHSEAFWVWVIEQATARLLDNPRFTLEPADEPYVSGHSVSEHLQYCLAKYCPDKMVEEARQHYYAITHHEMAEILAGRGRVEAFTPAPGLKEFLLTLKDRGIRIGLVTSGLYEKAWPEIVSAFRVLKLGDPLDFYDAIISAGHAIRRGQVGTLGELAPKPHPWLYAETARIGLGLDPARRHRVVGLEDSGAGVVSIRLAGFAALGIGGGNIATSGTRPLLRAACASLPDALPHILGK